MSGLWRVHTSSLHWWTKNTTWSKISHQHWLHLLLTNCIGKLQNYVYVIISMVRGWGSPGGRSIGCMETRCKRKHRCLNWIPRNILCAMCILNYFQPRMRGWFPRRCAVEAVDHYDSCQVFCRHLWLLTHYMAFQVGKRKESCKEANQASQKKSRETKKKKWERKTN